VPRFFRSLFSLKFLLLLWEAAGSSATRLDFFAFRVIEEALANTYGGNHSFV
jgi:hypothetical protein